MQISKTNNVIFLKDVESNIIKEAFIVLNDNVRFENQAQEKVISNVNKTIDVLKEAELLINEEISKKDWDFEKYKLIKLSPIPEIVTVPIYIIR